MTSHVKKGIIMIREKVCRLGGLLLMFAALSGCAGSTVVDFKTQLDVHYADAQGQPQNAAPVSITTLKDETRLSPFPPIRYQDTLLSCDIEADNIAIHYLLTNLTAEAMTIDWGHAVVTSSQQPAERALTAAFFQLSQRPLPPQQQLAPGAALFSALSLRYGELFQSGRLFDVQYVQHETHLYNSGVGEWLLIKLPIQIGDKRLIKYIKLTAIDAKARLSHY